MQYDLKVREEDRENWQSGGAAPEKIEPKLFGEVELVSNTEWNKGEWKCVSSI